MTTEDLYNKLEKLIADGKGDLKIGYFDHEYGNFWEIKDIIVSVDRDYDPKTPQEVIEVR